MNELTAPERKPPIWSIVIVILLALMPAFYVLSVGPAALLAVWMSTRPGPDLEWPIELVNSVYAPVEWLSKATETTSLIAADIEWWIQLQGIAS